jgi:hypothetical protein
VYAPCSGIATSTGALGSTRSIAAPRRHPLSGKLDAINTTTSAKTASVRIRVRKFAVKHEVSSARKSRFTSRSRAICVQGPANMLFSRQFSLTGESIFESRTVAAQSKK